MTGRDWKLIALIVIATVIAEIVIKQAGINGGCGCGR